MLMDLRKPVVVWSPYVSEHDERAHHPVMDAKRLFRIGHALTSISGIRHIKPAPADLDLTLALHDEHTIEALEALQPGETCRFGSETVANGSTSVTMGLTLGGIYLAIDEVLAGSCQHAFNVGYAGHHAGPDGPQGFCFLNAVASGVAYAKVKGVSRVAVLDFDTHSGNGTIACLSKLPDVFFGETYQAGYAQVIPKDYLSHNVKRFQVCDQLEFLQRWDELLASLQEWKPQLVLVSAGFDGLEADPLSDIGLDEAAYVELARKLSKVSTPCVYTLEGGYAKGRTAHAVRAFFEEIVRGSLFQSGTNLCL